MHVILLFAFSALFGLAWAQELPPEEPLLPPPAPLNKPPAPAEGGDSASVEGPRRAMKLTLDDLVYAEAMEDGLLVVIVDPENVLGGVEPSGRFGRGDQWTSLSFRDDGESPDGIGGDQQYVAWGPIPERTGMTEIHLLGADDTVLYSDDRIPIPWERELPVVALLLLKDGGHIPTIETNDLDAVEVREALGAREMYDAEESNSGAVGGRASIEIGTEASGANTALLLKTMVMALALGLGLCGAVYLHRRRERAIRVQPAGVPSVEQGPDLGTTRVWVLADHAQRLDCMVALARARSGAGRVLLCPRPESRPALRDALRGLVAVVWAQLERPSPKQLIRVSSDRLTWGRPLVLVEGVNALEPRESQEDPGAVIQDLLQLDVGKADLLVLLTPEEPAGALSTRELSSEDLQALGLQVPPHE